MIAIKTIKGKTVILPEESFSIIVSEEGYVVRYGNSFYPISEEQYKAIREYVVVTDLSVKESVVPEIEWETERPVPEREWEVGDTLEITGHDAPEYCNPHGFKIGQLVTIHKCEPLDEDTSHMRYYCLPLIGFGNDDWWISKSEAKLVENEQAN